MKKLACLAGAAILALGTTAAFAGGPDQAPAPVSMDGWYAGMSYGTAFYANDAGLAHHGFNVDAAGGYRWGHFRFEGALGYQENSLNTAMADYEVLTLMANAYYDFHVTQKLNPYVGAGIGWAHREFNGSAGTANFDSMAVGTSDNSFAWQVMGGVDYAINNNLSVGARYTYRDWTDASSYFDNIVSAVFNYYFV